MALVFVSVLGARAIGDEDYMSVSSFILSLD